MPTREVSFYEEEKTPQEKMRIYNRKYRERHSEQIVCACGGSYKIISKYTHTKSKKHLDFVERQNK